MSNSVRSTYFEFRPEQEIRRCGGWKRVINAFFISFPFSRCFFCSVLKTVGVYAGELNKNLIVVSLYVINQCEMTKPDDLCVDMPVKLHTETS